MFFSDRANTEQFFLDLAGSLKRISDCRNCTFIEKPTLTDIGFFQVRIAVNLFSLGIGLFLITCNRMMYPLPSSFLFPIIIYDCENYQLYYRIVPRKKKNSDSHKNTTRPPNYPLSLVSCSEVILIIIKRVQYYILSLCDS